MNYRDIESESVDVQRFFRSLDLKDENGIVIRIDERISVEIRPLFLDGSESKSTQIDDDSDFYPGHA